MKLQAGDRVRVSEGHHWAQGTTGTVEPYPDYVADFTGRDRLTDVSIWVETVGGGVEQAWVVFDQPQLDADGDGPYAAGVIDIPDLELLISN